MPTPQFIVELRSHVGHAPLWLIGSSAVVLRTRDDGVEEVLLVKRSDDGRWTVIGGIPEPGEEPHLTVVREAMEETGVVVEVEKLLAVAAVGPTQYLNGDVTSYLDHCFRCRWVSGEPYPADDESTDARWFPVDDLPPMQHTHTRRVRIALDNPDHVLLGWPDEV